MKVTVSREFCGKDSTVNTGNVIRLILKQQREPQIFLFEALKLIRLVCQKEIYHQSGRIHPSSFQVTRVSFLSFFSFSALILFFMECKLNIALEDLYLGLYFSGINDCKEGLVQTLKFQFSCHVRHSVTYNFLE